MEEHYQIRGECNKCGDCCKDLNIKSKGKWISTDQEFLDLLTEDPEYEKMIPIGRRSNGYLIFKCEWLKDDNTCKDHENRLSICRTFPHTEIFKEGAILPENCSYEIHHKLNFEDLLKGKIREQKFHMKLNKLFLPFEKFHHFINRILSRMR